jgi:hypothetical protein
MPADIPHPVLEAALAYSGAGFRVHPVRWRSKVPLIPEWTTRASVERQDVVGWFHDPKLNVGIVAGPQPNGQNLLVIDIDPLHGGELTWKALLREHGAGDLAKAAIHRTARNGWHIFLAVPDGFVLSNSAGLLGAGIDVKWVGGQVVAPPSVWLDPSTGELLAYTAQPGCGLADRPVLVEAPGWLLDLLLRQQVIIESIGRHPSQFKLDDSVADLARQGWDWCGEMVADGWVVSHQRGDQVFVTRPGKSVREGHSAVIHLDSGHLVVWSTSVPSELARPLRQGQANRDGSLSWSPWDYIVAVRCGGDNKAAAALVRGTVPLPAPAGGQVRAVPPATVDDTPGGVGPPVDRLPMLPPEFWEHPINAHILAAARARRCGPDALALNVLLRAAMLVPPSFLLPPLAGGKSPLNLLGCVVGRTGEGKSVSIAAAADVVAVEHPWLLWDMPLGSGEGVGDVFMMDEYEETPRGRKKTGRRVQNKALYAVHFTVDEGAALVEQSTRKGATIIPALCKAWTGVTLGETNADVMTRRRVKALTYRVTAVINIQPVNFHRLFNTANTGTGLTGRFLFAPAADYEMPDQRGVWPGTLEFPVLHASDTGNMLSYDPEIEAEVDAAIVYANRHGGTPEKVSHSNLLRARVASLYALWEDRRTITLDDWGVAGLLTETSAATLDTLDRHAAALRRDERHTQAMVKAEVEIVVEDVKERQGIARMAEAIRARVTDGPVARAQVRKAVSASSTRHRFEAALNLARSNGWIRVEEDRIESI